MKSRVALFPPKTVVTFFIIILAVGGACLQSSPSNTLSYEMGQYYQLLTADAIRSYAPIFFMQKCEY